MSAALWQTWKTERGGYFRASGLSAGDHRIEVSKPNYVTTTLRIAVVDGVPPTTLLVHLVRCGSISGQVTDQQSHAVPGAFVFAMNKALDEGFVLPFGDFSRGIYATVDERGEYRLFNLPPGEFVVAVTYGASTMAVGTTGGATTKASAGSGVLFFPNNTRPEFFTVSGGEEFRDVDFIIAPAAFYSVRGKVEPVTANGNFWLALTPVGQTALAVAVTQADRDGTFHFEGVPQGSYHLFASGPSAARSGRGGILGATPLFGRSHVDVVGQDIEDVLIAAQKGVSVAFVVRSPSGDQAEKPCPGTAHLKLIPLEDWGADIERETDVSFPGEQKIDHLAPARYRVRAEMPGNMCYQVASQVIDLAEKTDDRPVVIALATAGMIRGRIIAGSARPSDFAVVLLQSDPPDRGQQLQVALPDSEFRFAFGALRPGRYLISAPPAGEVSRSRWVQNPSGMLAIDVAAGATTEIELPIASTQKNP